MGYESQFQATPVLGTEEPGRASHQLLLAGDAEANEEEYMANGPYTGPLTIDNVPKLHTV